MSELPTTTTDQNSQMLEEKKPLAVNPSSYEYLIPETRKFIKKGNFKKAFRMLDTYFGDPKKIGAVQKVQLCRRLMASIVTICTKALNKPELHKQERLLKLLDAGTSYLFHWHNGLSDFIVKTNKMFEHLNAMLVELSGSSDDDQEDAQTEIDSDSRSPSLRDSTRTYSQNPASASRTRIKNEKRATLLVQILKNQDKPDGSSNNVLDNSFNNMDGSHLLMEEFKGSEINAQFYLDEFLIYLMKHLLNYALYHKKFREYGLAFKYFSICYRLSKQLESSRNTNLLHICSKVRISVGIFYLEFGRHQEAQQIFDSATQVLQSELTLRFNQDGKKDVDEEKFMKGVVKTVKMLCMNLLNMAKSCELQLRYSKVIECYKVAFWFARKILIYEDEFVKTIVKSYYKASEEYGVHLEEIAECERVVFEGKDMKASLDQKPDANKNDQFYKLQELLYNKFNYSELNKRQVPIKTANTTFMIDRNNKSDLYGNRFDLRDEMLKNEGPDTIKTSLRESMSGNPSAQRSLNEGHTDRPSSQRDIRNRRDKKNAKKSLDRNNSEGKKPLLADRYFESNPAEELNALHVDEEEEKRYTQQLNRNLIRIRPKTGTSVGSQASASINKTTTTQDTLGYTDIDGFFTNRVEKMIKLREDAKSKPQDFSKNENFDQKEFKHAREKVKFRKSELLGEKQTEHKEFVLKHHAREKSQFVTTRTQAENYIQSRINVSKTLTSSPRNENKKAYTSVGMMIPKKPATTYLDSDRTEDYDGRTSSSFFANREEKAGRIALAGNRAQARSQSATRSRVSYGGVQNKPEGDEAKVDSEELKRINALIKERINGMLEEIDSEIKDDAFFSRRIKMNKPIFQLLTEREKFFKGKEDLAKSCKFISIKREVSKKPTEEFPRRPGQDERKKDRGRRRLAQNFSQRSQSLDPDFSPSKNLSFFPGA